MNGSSAASNATPVTSQPSRPPFTSVEHFAGIGLFRMGLEQAGWQVVHANDWSAERTQIYNGFFGESYRVKDVFSLTAAEIPRETLATCSFPCIDLSQAGKRKGINGQHSGAFWGLHDILKRQGENAPPVVLLENVTGWLYSNGGNEGASQIIVQLPRALSAGRKKSCCIKIDPSPAILQIPQSRKS